MTPVPQQDFTSMVLTVTVVLAIICTVAIVLIKWVFPRIVRSPLTQRKNGPIRILARYALEPRVAVYVMRIGRKHVVVGSSDRGLVSLAELSETELADEWKEKS